MDNLAALEHALDLMEPGEDPRLWPFTIIQIRNSLRYGPVPVPEAIDRARLWRRSMG